MCGGRGEEGGEGEGVRRDREGKTGRVFGRRINQQVLVV